MRTLCRLSAAIILSFAAATAASAVDIAVFPLSDEQLKAFDEYAAAKGEKAFAAGPAGQFSAQVGFASAAAAATEALRACDKDQSEAARRCILVDTNGNAVPHMLQLAQISRADPTALDRPLPLRDFILDEKASAALDGYAAMAEHKAFAASIKGAWARSWEAASLEDAEKHALETCNKLKAAAGAPCFLLWRDGERTDPATLAVNPDLTVAKQP